MFSIFSHSLGLFRRILSFRERYIAVHAMGSLFDTQARNHSLTHTHTYTRRYATEALPIANK